MQSEYIITIVVSSNPVHGEVYSIQQYVIKFLSDLRQVGGFLQFPPPIKHRYDIIEILLQVAINTINQTIPLHSCKTYSTKAKCFIITCIFINCCLGYLGQGSILNITGQKRQLNL